MPDGYSQTSRSYMFGPSGFWTMAPLRYAAKFDPFLSLDCAPTPSNLAQSKERKGSNFAIWQPCDRLGDIGVEMLPDEAKKDVVEFVRINSKYSLTLEEKEQQEAYFRTQSEKNLAGLCPKLGSTKLSGKSEE